MPNTLAPLLAPGYALDSVWALECIGADKLASARDTLGAALAESLDTPSQRLSEFLKALES
jgi:hypothetical protein